VYQGILYQRRRGTSSSVVQNKKKSTCLGTADMQAEVKQWCTACCIDESPPRGRACNSGRVEVCRELTVLEALLLTQVTLTQDRLFSNSTASHAALLPSQHSTDSLRLRAALPLTQLLTLTLKPCFSHRLQAASTMDLRGTPLLPRMVPACIGWF
jgi:hypothetical protein